MGIVNPNFQGEIELPGEVISGWQSLLDMAAMISGTTVSQLMKTDAPVHRVMLQNTNMKHPYKVGQAFKFHPFLYCFGVYENDGALVVEDAKSDPRWANNDDLVYGMSFYVGYPLKWPDGKFFGTICLLDNKPNKRALLFKDFLVGLAKIVESDLKLAVELELSKLAEKRLREQNEELKEQLKAESNRMERFTQAMQLLMHEFGGSDIQPALARDKLLESKNLPILARLRQHVAEDAKALELLNQIEGNLCENGQGPSQKLQQFLKDLTPVEQEIVQRIMQGQSTKEIAASMERGNTTVEFHRNNIRKKLGLKSRDQNLRSSLLAL